jgi:hypothetical protein
MGELQLQPLKPVTRVARKRQSNKRVQGTRQQFFCFFPYLYKIKKAIETKQ